MALEGSTSPPAPPSTGSEEQHKCVFCGHCFPTKPELQTHFRLHANGIIDIKGHPKVRQKVDSRPPPRTSTRTTTTTTASTTTTVKPTTTSTATTTTTTTATSGKSSAVCDVCGEAFHTVSLAISHKFRKHPDSVAKHYCPHCGMMFPIKLSRDKHLLTHSSAPPKQLFPCRPCGVTFYNQRAKKFHMDSAHKGATRMVNPVRTPAPSMKIVVNNAGEPLSVYYCHLCGCEYQVKYNLQKHLATKHNQGERDALPKELVQCNLCSAVFYSKRAYEAHSHHHRDGDLFATNEEMRQQVVQRIDQDFDHRRVPTPVERYLSASAVTSNRSATWRNIQAMRRAQSTTSSSTSSSSSSSTPPPISLQSISSSSSSSSSSKINKKEEKEEEEEKTPDSSSSSSSSRLKEEEEEEEEEEKDKKITFLTNSLPLRGGGEEGGGRGGGGGGGGTQGDFLPWGMDDGRRKRRRRMMDESEEEEDGEVMRSLGNVNPDTILSRGLMRREEEEEEEEERKAKEEEEGKKKKKRRKEEEEEEEEEEKDNISEARSADTEEEEERKKKEEEEES